MIRKYDPKKNLSSSNKISIGNSVTYFVAAELERRGFTSVVLMSNAKDFNVLSIY